MSFSRRAPAPAAPARRSVAAPAAPNHRGGRAVDAALPAPSAVPAASRAPLLCYRCSQPGHIARNCTVTPQQAQRRAQPATATSHASEKERKPEGVVSELELTTAAFFNFAEELHTAEPFKLPPLWPMVRHAAQPRFGLTAAYFAKMLDRYGDDLTELDLSSVLPNELARVETMIAQRVLPCLRVLRGVVQAKTRFASCAPNLEELYAPDDACTGSNLRSVRITDAWLPSDVPHFARLQKCQGLSSNAHLPRLVEATLAVTPSADDFAAFLERSPLLTSLEMERGASLKHITVLADSCVAPTLRHFGCDTVFALDILSQLPLLDSLRVGGKGFQLGQVLARMPNLTKLQIRNGSRGPMPSFETIAHLHTLDLHGIVFTAAEMTTPPVAVQNLRCINCTLPDSFINVFVHPGLKSLEMTDIRSTVLDALKSSAPRLHTLILSGNCDAEGAVTDYRKVWHLKEVLASCGGDLKTLSFNIRFRADGARQFNVSLPHTAWNVVAEHCGKLTTLHTNFKNGVDGLSFLGALRSCRRLQSLTCVVNPDLMSHVQEKCASLTAGRDLSLNLLIYHAECKGTVLLRNGQAYPSFHVRQRVIVHGPRFFDMEEFINDNSGDDEWY